MKIVGASLPRLEGMDKASGSAVYVEDLYRPGMLHGALLLSPHPHARIVSCDTSRAAALPGVRAVVCGSDFPERRVGVFVKDEVILAQGKVRYAGEPVAAVAARSLAIARAAAALIVVEYEPLPAVLSIDQALAANAPLVHENLERYVFRMPARARRNIIWEVDLAQGDVDAAWAQCDAIVEGIYETQAQYHAYLETNGVLAEADQSGNLTVWASCQSVHHVQTRIAEELGLPMSKIRVAVPRVGGAFGGKHASNLHSIAAALALKAKAPVKLVLTRTEDFEMQRSRHPVRIHLRTGARSDGTILAREARLLFDGGAYADESPAVMSFASLMVRGCYRIPHVRVHGTAVYTNKLRAGSFRAFGNPQATFAGESQIDELALKLGIDPVALRRKNLMQDGDYWIGGHRVAVCSAGRCLDRLIESVRAAPPLPPPRRERRRGIGYSMLASICGLMGTSASVHLRGDGTVALSTGVVDIGQGSDTTLAQICAELLGLPIESVSYGAPDTAVSPYNWKTAASRSTYMTGRAVAGGSNHLKEQILRHAADMLESAEADLEFRSGGRVGVVGVPGRELSFAQIAQHSLYVAGGPIIGVSGLVFDGPPFDPKRATVERFAFDNLGVYIFGAQAVEVEVDEATGQVAVLRAWSAHDVGRAINPASVEGQIQGAFVQGLGYALTEEMVWNDGRLINPSLAEYAVPGIEDVPFGVHPIILEEPEPTGPFGAKGVGEPALSGVAAAIANAIAQAFNGARPRRLPMTPERVLDAIEPPAGQA
ncbi:MAG TPA: xanthine dehydrogenase family protein molybdopterin-binding subunit [Stellaceae bacterium]|nr:xanthine dehydrogenase family protein molybdopterin-binding subunit [Stellaceae bacterium]